MLTRPYSLRQLLAVHLALSLVLCAVSWALRREHWSEVDATETLRELGADVAWAGEGRFVTLTGKSLTREQWQTAGAALENFREVTVFAAASNLDDDNLAAVLGESVVWIDCGSTMISNRSIPLLAASSHLRGVVLQGTSVNAEGLRSLQTQSPWVTIAKADGSPMFPQLPGYAKYSRGRR